MYQNLNRYSPEQIKGADDVEGGRGTEAEDGFPFVDDYKGLWRDRERETDRQTERKITAAP